MQPLKSLLHKNLYGQALKNSTTLHNSKLTTTIYAQFIKSNTTLNPFQSASLITHFSRSGELSLAAYLLRHTENPDIVVFNALISSYARFNQTGPAFEVFNCLRELGLSPDEVSYSNLIKCCNNLSLTESVHVGFLKLGFGANVFLISGLIENYARFGCMDSVTKCFDECLVFDGVIWSVMINGCVRNGEFDKGRECFTKMMNLGFEFNEFSLTSVLGAVFDVEEGEQIHGYCVKRGYLYSSMHLNNALMVMYGRSGCKNNAVKVFDEMPDRDIVSWTARIGVAFDCLEAFEIFRCCNSRGYEINEYTMINVLSQIEGAEMVILGKQIHTIIWKAGYLVVTSVCNALISMYAKAVEIHDARKVFDEMPQPDSVSWNSLINSYFHHHVCSRKSTMQIHSLTLKLGLIYTDSVICHLITAYGKCNVIDGSKTLFSEIDMLDTVHVNAMLGAYDHCGCYTDIQTLFHKRWNSSLNVDFTTFNIVLKSCGALSDLNKGKSLHSLAVKTAFSTDKFIESALIDVYNKCGCLDDAENVFRTATNNNLVAWNAMIMGYAQCGCHSQCYNLLTKIIEFRMKPDEITYLGILISCSHAGMVNEARYHLNSMFNFHGITPCLEHYACVVDVLGKSGQVYDAMKIIKEMPMLPDARIWQILLSACNNYGNVDIGVIAARNLVALQPENESSFVLLSNLYASTGMWDDVRHLRRLMKDKTVYKEPGCSWIQVKQSVHYFYASDSSHRENQELYMELHSLMNQMLQLSKEQDTFLTQLTT